MENQNLYIGSTGRTYVPVPASEKTDPTRSKCEHCAFDAIPVDCGTVLCSADCRLDGCSVFWVEDDLPKDPNPL